MIDFSKRLILASLFVLPAFGVHAWDRTRATVFGVLPDGAINPEGITADAEGNIYATTFGVTSSGPGHLVVFGPDGDLLRDVRVAGSSNLLLGLAFNPLTGDLLVLDFGNGKVLKVDPRTGASRVFFAAPLAFRQGGRQRDSLDRRSTAQDDGLSSVWSQRSELQ